MTQTNLAVEFNFQYPAQPKPLNTEERAEYKTKIKKLLKEKMQF